VNDGFFLFLLNSWTILKAVFLSSRLPQGFNWAVVGAQGLVAQVLALSLADPHQLHLAGRLDWVIEMKCLK
jgi:hypothetical protein